MKPTTFSPFSATMPMQLRWRRQRRKSSSVQENSKLSCSVCNTSGISRRIIQRMCTRTCSFSVRPVLMTDSSPPYLRLAAARGTPSVGAPRGRVTGGKRSDQDQIAAERSGGVLAGRKSARRQSRGCHRLPHHRRILATLDAPLKAKSRARGLRGLGGPTVPNRGVAQAAPKGRKWGNPSPVPTAFMAGKPALAGGRIRGSGGKHIAPEPVWQRNLSEKFNIHR